MDWQSATALGIVVATLALFSLGIASRLRSPSGTKKGSCGRRCSCPHPPKPGKS